MDGLGRVFNVVHNASGVHIPLKDCGAVTFVGYEDSGATDVTVRESVAGSSEQLLATVTRYHTSNGVGGAWATHVNGSPASLVEPTDDTAQDCWAFTISEAELSDGFTHVEVTVDGGSCVAILHDLDVQRAPANLAALV